MDTQNIRAYLQSNLLTTSEAAEILQVTKARITKLVEDGSLIPLKRSSQGLLFLKEDVIAYTNMRNRFKQMTCEPIFIKESTTHRCVDEFERHRYELGEIEAIFVFFNRLDAIISGYYEPAELLNYGEHKRVENAHFVIRDTNGKELWLMGCNCGYGGTGPHGTASILKYLREENTLPDSEFTDDAIEDLIFYRKISILKDENGNWEVIKSKSAFEDIDEHADLFFYRDRLVLIQDVSDYRYKGDYKILTTYQAFIPEPKQIMVFPTDEMAVENGYVINNMYRNTPAARIYNIILTDASGRQIWLKDSFKDKRTLLHNPSIKKILEACNFPNNPDHLLTDKGLAAVANKLSKWMDIIFNTEPDKPLIIERK